MAIIRFFCVLFWVIFYGFRNAPKNKAPVKSAFFGIDMDADTMQQAELRTTSRQQINLSKIDLVKHHLIQHGEIDNFTAMESYKVARLSSIILNLRAKGMDITTHQTKSNASAVYKYTEPNK